LLSIIRKRCCFFALICDSVTIEYLVLRSEQEQEQAMETINAFVPRNASNTHMATA
jgi:hypothetical protein